MTLLRPQFLWREIILASVMISIMVHKINVFSRVYLSFGAGKLACRDWEGGFGFIIEMVMGCCSSVGCCYHNTASLDVVPQLAIMSIYRSFGGGD